jgi:hypothetical protein
MDCTSLRQLPATTSSPRWRRSRRTPTLMCCPQITWAARFGMSPPPSSTRLPPPPSPPHRVPSHPAPSHPRYHPHHHGSTAIQAGGGGTPHSVRTPTCFSAAPILTLSTAGARTAPGARAQPVARTVCCCRSGWDDHRGRCGQHAARLRLCARGSVTRDGASQHARAHRRRDAVYASPAWGKPCTTGRGPAELPDLRSLSPTVCAPLTVRERRCVVQTRPIASTPAAPPPTATTTRGRTARLPARK